jgi:DNA-binding transcriptional regulator YiaG
MTAAELRAALARVGHSQRGFAAYTGVNERTVRRWIDGEQDVPKWVGVMLTLLERLQVPARNYKSTKRP